MKESRIRSRSGWPSGKRISQGALRIRRSAGITVLYLRGITFPKNENSSTFFENDQKIKKNAKKTL